MILLIDINILKLFSSSHYKIDYSKYIIPFISFFLIRNVKLIIYGIEFLCIGIYFETSKIVGTAMRPLIFLLYLSNSQIVYIINNIFNTTKWYMGLLKFITSLFVFYYQYYIIGFTIKELTVISLLKDFLIAKSMYSIYAFIHILYYYHITVYFIYL